MMIGGTPMYGNPQLGNTDDSKNDSSTVQFMMIIWTMIHQTVGYSIKKVRSRQPRLGIHP